MLAGRPARQQAKASALSHTPNGGCVSATPAIACNMIGSVPVRTVAWYGATVAKWLWPACPEAATLADGAEPWCQTRVFRA
jgi:hypothetical protein